MFCPGQWSWINNSPLARESPPLSKQKQTVADSALLCRLHPSSSVLKTLKEAWCEERHITIAIGLTLTFKLNLAVRATRPPPAPLRCKEADGFDPWSHFLTRPRCQITFWPRKHLQVAWAASDLAVIDGSTLFCCFVQYGYSSVYEINNSSKYLLFWGQNMTSDKYSIVHCWCIHVLDRYRIHFPW